MDQALSGTFRLQVLGIPSLRDSNGVTPPSLGWGKPLALLCLLAVRGEARREEVVDLLWRGVEEDKAKNAFRQALHRLRGALGDELSPQDRERIRLVRSNRITIDLDEFEAATRAGRLEAALAVYTGDFLEGTSLGEATFEHWAEQERTRLRVVLRQVLHDAVTAASASGDWPQAVAYAKRLMAVAPFEASAAQIAATTMISAGRRVEAQDLIRQFAARLDSELGLPLPAELQSLTSRIDRQERARTPQSSAATLASLPFVGREKELSQLMTLWRTTSADSGAFVLVEGEAGIGKTRLLRELAANAKSLGPALVLSGSERAIGASLPYAVFAEALRPLARAKGILGASRHLLAEAARLLPELRDEIDLPAATDIEDDTGRLRFFEGIAALIDAAAFEQPALILLDDLQHISPSSLDLLSYLAVRLVGSPVMFVVTLVSAVDAAPPTQRVRALAESSEHSSPPHGQRAKRLRLEPLSHTASIAAIQAGTRALGVDAGQQDRVVQLAGGNAAQLAELTRRLVAHEELPGRLVDMRSLTRDRVDRLSSAERRALLALALIGRPVTLDVIAAAAHLSTSAAEQVILGIVHARLAERHNGVVVADATAMDLVLDAAGPSGRSFLAGWVADALAADATSKPGEVARLYSLAGLSQNAYRFSRQAALAALAVGAVQESIQFLNSARTFAGTQDDQREIESFLTALGSGRRRLRPHSPIDAAPTEPTTTPLRREPESRWRALFPNWRLLLGGAVATLVVSAVVLAARPGPIRVASRSLLADTLVVREEDSGRIRYVTGNAAGALALSDRSLSRPSNPAWIDSLSRPWIDPVASPRGSVALGKVTSGGSDVFVISADRRDTITLITNQGDARPYSWSPDGRWLLAASTYRKQSQNVGASLFAYRVVGGAIIVPIDTSPLHAITEAAWSPDGSRIAWVARTGASKQLDVFVSRADGRELRNVSHNQADDYHIAWSPDGELLAFTSTRDGNAEIYAHSFSEDRIWRLTFDNAQDDLAAFSRTGHWVAFESTRGGTSGIYVMPSLGGRAERVASGPSLAIDSWTSGHDRFVDRVRILLPSDVAIGDSVAVRLAAFDQFDDTLTTSAPTLVVLDSARARLAQTVGDSTPRLIALREGLVRVVGSVGGWRSDTAFVRIGHDRIDLLTFGREADWLLLGKPAPVWLHSEGLPTVVVNADREWDSGVLSRATVPLMSGLTVSSNVIAPFSATNIPAMSLGVALVAPEESGTVDADAPQFLHYASFAWNAEAGRFVYSVGREVFTETAVASGPLIRLTLRVETDSTVTFLINDAVRWHSTLRVQDARHDWRANVWFGGRATGTRLQISDGRVYLAPATSSR